MDGKGERPAISEIGRHAWGTGFSEHAEVDLDFEVDGDGFAVLRGGLEAVLLDGFDGLGVELIAHAFRYPHFSREAVLVDDERDDDVPGELGGAE